MRGLRSLGRHLPSIARTPAIDDSSGMLESVTSAFIAPGISAILATGCYHLAVSRVARFNLLMEGLGNLFISTRQPVDLANGYPGIYGGVFIVYTAALFITFSANLKLPSISIQNLPAFILVSGILNAILAWSLFFPWIGLE